MARCHCSLGHCGGAGSVPGLVQWVKGSVIAAAVTCTQLWLGCSLWTSVFCMPWAQSSKLFKKVRKHYEKAASIKNMQAFFFLKYKKIHEHDGFGGSRNQGFFEKPLLLNIYIGWLPSGANTSFSLKWECWLSFHHEGFPRSKCFGEKYHVPVSL